MAPSKVKDTEVICVTEHIFGASFASNSEIKNFLEPQLPVSQELQEVSSSVATTPSHPSQHNEEKHILYCVLLTDIYTSTHNLAEEEPPGYLPLGCLVVYFGQFLSKALNTTYKCHPQRTVARNINRGQNPSTDVAIILREHQTTSRTQYISKVL